MSILRRNTGEAHLAAAGQAKVNAQEFSTLYQENLNLIYRFVYSKIGNREEAEDLTSQIFIKAVRGINTERGPLSVQKWLFQVARTTIADYWRAHYHGAHPPQELTPAQARIYRMATQFHAATSGVGEPRAEFAIQLQARLEEELQEQQKTQQLPPIQHLPSSSPPKRRISRRVLLAGSAAAAAAGIAVGAGMEHMVEQAAPTVPPVVGIGTGLVTKWFPVTTVAELGNQAIKFTKAELIGYVVRCDDTAADPADRGKIIAVSAACTHKGCIVRWDNSDRKFHCPCHGGVFTEEGNVDPEMSSLYLNGLPRLEVLIKNEQIYVRMPTGL